MKILNLKEKKEIEIKIKEIGEKISSDPGNISVYLKELEELQDKLKEIEEILNPEYDISNYKFQYIKERLDKLNGRELEKFKCQSLEFFIDKIKKSVKNIIILGLIQSGKTSEIINILHYCTVCLEIPVVIIIQNRTSGYYQLENRIKEFQEKLRICKIPCKYVKNSLNQNSSKYIFNPKKPRQEVLIALSNYKQLDKLHQNIENVKNHNNKKNTSVCINYG